MEVGPGLSSRKSPFIIRSAAPRTTPRLLRDYSGNYIAVAEFQSQRDSFVSSHIDAAEGSSLYGEVLGRQPPHYSPSPGRLAAQFATIEGMSCLYIWPSHGRTGSEWDARETGVRQHLTSIHRAMIVPTITANRGEACPRWSNEMRTGKSPVKPERQCEQCRKHHHAGRPSWMVAQRGWVEQRPPRRQPVRSPIIFRVAALMCRPTKCST